MQHQVEQTLPHTLVSEYCDSIESGSGINPRNDHGGSTTYYPHHRVGYDGQVKVFSTEYAIILFSALLFISFNGNKNSFTSTEEQLYVQW